LTVGNQEIAGQFVWGSDSGCFGGQQIHLQHCAARKGVHHGAGGRFDFRGRFSNLAAGDAFDFLPHLRGGTGEKLAVKLLHLGRANRALGQRSLGRRQGLVQGDDQRVLVQDHGHHFRSVARALQL
jgi:hypothetical protein